MGGRQAEMDIRHTIGRRIHRLRRQRDLTQQGLAERIGVNASYIGPLEKGLKCPSIAVLEKLAEELGQPVFSFFLEDGSSETPATEGTQVAALLAAHPLEERRFLLRALEDLSALLRARPGLASNESPPL